MTPRAWLGGLGGKQKAHRECRARGAAQGLDGV